MDAHQLVKPPRRTSRRPPDAGDAIELAELLQFLGDWLASDSRNLTASLAQYVGTPAYGFGELRADLARFRFLLGVTDGEGLFTPDEET